VRLGDRRGCGFFAERREKRRALDEFDPAACVGDEIHKDQDVGV